MSSTPPSVPPPAPPSARRSRPWPWLALVLLLAVAAWLGWQGWLAWQHQLASSAQEDQRLEAYAGRLDALRRDQRAQAQRLQQADATNRVLREELLGLGQRAALLEEAVAGLADPERAGAQALRLDEAELLLSMGQQRLRIAADLQGARRAYALAAGVLEGVDDPAYLSLRQSLMQERAALEAIDSEPRARVLSQLDDWMQATLAAPPAAEAVPRDAAAPWWRRALEGLVQVRPSGRSVAEQPSDRIAARAGLQLEITLARAAAERGDRESLRAAIDRADAWVLRLWPASAARERHRARLQAIAGEPLSLSLPMLGSTLRQLRQTRASPQRAPQGTR